MKTNRWRAPAGRRGRRSLLILLAAVMLLSLCACKQEEEPFDPEDITAIENLCVPLFKLAASEGESSVSARFFAVGEGILYLTKTDEGLYTCGFFVPPDMISNEDIFLCSDAENAYVFDMGEDTAAVVVDGRVYWVTLSAGSSIYYDIPENVRFSDILITGGGDLIYESDQLLLTSSIEFEQAYVLTDKTKLFCFAGVLGVSDDGERVFYAYDDGGQTGFAYFGYGYMAEALGKTDLAFDSYMRLGGPRVLFYKLDAGRQTFTYMDLDAGERRAVSVSVRTRYFGYSCDPGGKYLAALAAADDAPNGGVIDLWDLKQETLLHRYELPALPTNSGVVLGTKGKYLAFGQWDKGLELAQDAGEIVSYIAIAP